MSSTIIYFDDDPERRANNLRILELAKNDMLSLEFVVGSLAGKDKCRSLGSLYEELWDAHDYRQRSPFAGAIVLEDSENLERYLGFGDTLASHFPEAHFLRIIPGGERNLTRGFMDAFEDGYLFEEHVPFLYDKLKEIAAWNGLAVPTISTGYN